MISDFYPFRDNQKVTAAQWNELMTAIQDGSFFLDVAPIADQIYSLANRVTAVEERLNVLEPIQAFQRKRLQYQLTSHQTRIELEEVPRLDSEMVALNGTILSKSGIPLGFNGDYTVDGNVINLSTAWQPLIVDGDMVVVNYEFEVVE